MKARLIRLQSTRLSEADLSELDPLFSEKEISVAVKRIAGEIANDHRDNNPLLVGILKGSYVFLADLSRGIGIPHEIDFIRARSYGKGMRSSGAIEITKDIETDVTGRHIILVEDIADTGLTMNVVAERLLAGEPASVYRCALLLREGSEPVPEYLGMTVGPGFVVGYGIDYGEEHRGLRDIRVVRGTT